MNPNESVAHKGQAGEAVMPGEDFASWVASLSDEQRSRITPAERAERLIESARQQREHERDLARQAGWR